MATVEPKTLPLTALQMEQRVHPSQAFVPIDCASYLVLVAPHGPDDMPDLGNLRAFRRPATRA